MILRRSSSVSPERKEESKKSTLESRTRQFIPRRCNRNVTAPNLTPQPLFVRVVLGIPSQPGTTPPKKPALAQRVPDIDGSLPAATSLAQEQRTNYHLGEFIHPFLEHLTMPITAVDWWAVGRRGGGCDWNRVRSCRPGNPVRYVVFWAHSSYSTPRTLLAALPLKPLPAGSPFRRYAARPIRSSNARFKPSATEPRYGTVPSTRKPLFFLRRPNAGPAVVA